MYMELSYLIDELLLLIFVEIDPRDLLLNLSRVCYRFYLLIKNDSIWRHHCKKNFLGLYNLTECNPKNFFLWYKMYGNGRMNGIFSSRRDIFDEKNTVFLIETTGESLDYIHEWAQLNPGERMVIISNDYYFKMRLLANKTNIFTKETIQYSDNETFITENGCTIYYYFLPSITRTEPRSFTKITRYLLYNIHNTDRIFPHLSYLMEKHNTTLCYRNVCHSKMLYQNNLFWNQSHENVIVVQKDVLNGKQININMTKKCYQNQDVDAIVITNGIWTIVSLIQNKSTN